MVPFHDPLHLGQQLLLARQSEEEAQLMVAGLTAAIYTKGFHWKASSSECLASSNAKPLGLICKTSDQEVLHFRHVAELLALGVLLDCSGSTSTSVSYRMIQADESFQIQNALLSDERGGLCDRLRSFMSSIGQCFLYRSGGWLVTSHLLTRVRAWGITQCGNAEFAKSAG